ncbi:MAG: DUF1553 domain-containing protein [Rhodopirellula sp. JB044]|uniref:DUF1553 domain-containing protein n=1 Tax=Rhodopirellula sp. JB044 TaxID=3342844 RepID=UPI00370B5C51
MTRRPDHPPDSERDVDVLIGNMIKEGFAAPDVDPKFAEDLKEQLNRRLSILAKGNSFPPNGSSANKSDDLSAQDRSAAEPFDSTSVDTKPYDQPTTPVETRQSNQASSWGRISLGLVASAAAVLMMLMWPAGTAHSFEIMRARLSDQAFVRANFMDAGRPFVGWLSTEGEFAALESAEAVVVSNQNGLLTRFDRDARTINAVPTGVTAQRNIRVLQVLAAIRDTSNSSLHIVSESTRRIDNRQGADVELTVRFRDDDSQSDPFNVRFGIESESGLPVWMEVDSPTHPDRAGETLPLAYPAQGPTELASLGIPASLATKMASGNLPMPGSDSVVTRGNDSESEETDDEQAFSAGSLLVPPSDGADESEPDPIVTVSSSEDAKTEDAAAAPLSSRRWDVAAPVDVPDDAVAMAKVIDDRLSAVWQSRGMRANPPADSYTLFRRMHLDLIGRIPHVGEIRRAFHDGEPNMDAVINELLDLPDFDSNMAAVWSRWLLPPDVELEQFGGRPAFEAWLADQFASHVSYDEITRQLLLAEGRVGDQGPVLFTTALEMKPDHLAKQTARTFLGTRIDCAMCHDHPYDTWTQTDFWGYAALFARISRPSGTMNTMSSVLRVKDVGEGDVTLPDTDQVVPPRLLGAGLLEEPPQSDQRRRRLAEWLTDPSNRQFARAAVNLLWSHFFGAGLVEPRDDFGPHNPPLSKELMEQLAEYFIASGYDVRAVVRAIVLSDAYQQTSNADEPEERPTFNSMPVRWLTAEQLYDCLLVASGGRSGSVYVTDPTSGINRFSDTARAAFVEQFASTANNVLEYQAGIPQALSLMNGNLSNLSAGEDSSQLIRGLRAPFFSDEDRIETVFLSLLGRPPSADEMRLVQSLLEESADAPTAEILSDLVWALLNGAEFATNH